MTAFNWHLLQASFEGANTALHEPTLCAEGDSQIHLCGDDSPQRKHMTCPNGKGMEGCTHRLLSLAGGKSSIPLALASSGTRDRPPRTAAPLKAFVPNDEKNPLRESVSAPIGIAEGGTYPSLCWRCCLCSSSPFAGDDVDVMIILWPSIVRLTSYSFEILG